MTFEKIQEIIATQFDKDIEDITMTTDIQEDFGADSLDIVDLLMTIEDEFDIAIPDEDVTEMKTVSDLVKYIDNNQ